MAVVYVLMSFCCSSLISGFRSFSDALFKLFIFSIRASTRKSLFMSTICAMCFYLVCGMHTSL